MNLRSTTLFFGLLLSMLWLFGLTLAWKKAAPSPNLILPSLQDPDVKVHTVLVERGEGGKKAEDRFVKEKDHWYLVGERQKTRVEDFRVEGLIGDVKNAKRNEDVRPSDDLAGKGLSPPRRTVTLEGTLKDREKVWKYYVGSESPEKAFVYVNSSDRPDKAYPVPRQNVESLLYKDPGALRSLRIFDFTAESVTHLLLKQGDREVELKRGDDKVWRFVKPALGFAGFESGGATPAGKDEGGIKGLLNAVAHLRVDTEEDFVALGQEMNRFGLDEGKANLRIEVTSPGADKKARETKEVLLVGKRNPDTKKYYARLVPDEGVMEIDAKLLGPVERAIREPGAIRSKDVAAFEARAVDAVVFQGEGGPVTLYRPDAEKDWKLQAEGAEPRRGSEKAAQALLDALQGKGAILEFKDVPEADQKAFDAKWGLDKGAPTITVYAGGLDKDGAKEEKKDAKGKDAKKAADPALRKDKAVVTLAFGGADGDAVVVKRTLPGDVVSRFTVGKAIVEKVRPEEGLVLAYLDAALPLPAFDEVDEFYLLRRGAKVGLKREGSGKDVRWYFKDKSEPTGLRPADTGKAQFLIAGLTKLQARKWVEAIGPKTDLDKLGLQSPAVAVTLVTKKGRVPPKAIAAFVGMVASRTAPAALTAPAAALAAQAADKGELTTIWFGKEAEKEKDGPAVYARHSGLEYVFLVGPDVVKAVRDTDLRDPGLVLNTQATLAASEAAAAAGTPRAGLLFASPLMTAEVHRFDPASVKSVRVTLRTPAELRSFTFQRKGKAWVDVTGLQEFQVEPARVNQLVEKLGRLQAQQFVYLSGGPRSDQKLGPKEAALKVEMAAEGGATVALSVGAEFGHFGYFASSSEWPEAVFLVPAATVEPLLRGGVGYFAKEREVAGE